MTDRLFPAEAVVQAASPRCSRRAVKGAVIRRPRPLFRYRKRHRLSRIASTTPTKKSFDEVTRAGCSRGSAGACAPAAPRRGQPVSPSRRRRVEVEERAVKF